MKGDEGNKSDAKELREDFEELKANFEQISKMDTLKTVPANVSVHPSDMLSADKDFAPHAQHTGFSLHMMKRAHEQFRCVTLHNNQTMDMTSNTFKVSPEDLSCDFS
jgi:hypothetical protein